MFKLRLIYKVFILVLMSLFFISCGSDNSPSAPPNPVGFYPLAVKQIAYEESKNSSLSGNILVKQFDDTNGTTLKIERINVDGENTTIASMQAPQYTNTIALNDNILVVIYHEYDRASGHFLPKFNTYKIEDNNTITQLGTTLINTEINGSTPWNVGIVHTFFKDNILGIALDAQYDIDFDLYSVMLYSKDKNNNFSYLQTLTSDNNETDKTLFGYNSIDISESFIAVSEICKVNIFTQDPNSSLFVKTDSYTFNDNYCFLTFNMAKNHLFVKNRLWGVPTQYNLFHLEDDGKIANIEDLSYLKRGPSLVIGNSAFIPNENGFEIYTITDTNDSNSLVKSRDIDLDYYPSTILNGGSTFLTGNETEFLYMDFFETYPQDRLYILSDTNSTLYLDEGNIYPFYKIAASSIHKPISYSLSGDDSENFEIVDHAISPKAALNYENPVDLDANNIYEITLNISDAQGHAQALDFHVHLRDRDYVTKTVSYSDDQNRSALYFGNPLYLNNTDLVVGSRTDLYLFKVDENNLTQLASTATPSDLSDLSVVAKVNNTLLAGSAYYAVNDSISSAGAVGIYTYDDTNTSLNFKDILTSPEPTEHGLFGSQILVDNNTTLISEPGTYLVNPYESTGKVYIYNSDENATFMLKQTLEAPDAQQANAFGDTMAMDGDYLIVGAPGSNSWSGAAYFYKKDENGSMQYLETLFPSGNEIGEFGKHVALSSSYFVISAYSGIQHVTNLYVYKINPRNNGVGLVSIIYDVLANQTDALALEDNNVFIATYAKVEGYDTLQNIIQHYQIAEDGTVNLKETLVNHINQSTTTRADYQIASDSDSIVVSNIMTNVGEAYRHGSITLYKKDRD